MFAGDSVEHTPRSSVPRHQTIDLTRAYALIVQKSSYGEIRRIFDEDSSFNQTVEIRHSDSIELLEQILQPSRDCVEETLSTINPSPLTDLVATYFTHSENTSRLCFLLCQKVRQARLAYAPIYKLLDDLPLDFDSDSYTLSDAQCDLAHKAFLLFDSLENPFLSHDSRNFDGTRQCFSELGHQLNHHPATKPRSRVHLPYYCSTSSAYCLTAAAVGVALTAVVIATHALVVLVGSPVCFALFPLNMTKRKKVDHAQLDEASRSAYALPKELDTIDCLVAHLHADVENDKFSIHHSLEREVDRFLIQQVLKQLQRNRPSFMERLDYLVEHLVICLDEINGARSRILEKLRLHQLPE